MNRRIFGFLLVATSLSPACVVAEEKGPYVILTNLTRDDPYYLAAQCLARFRGAEAILDFETERLGRLREQIRRLRPAHVAVVVRPEVIDVNFAAEVFELATRMNDDPKVDFAYGFVTGATADEAVKLVANTQRAEREAAGFPRKFCAVAQTGKGIGTSSGPGSDILLRAMDRYAACFREDGWETHVAPWHGEGDPNWPQKKPKVLSQMQHSRMIFLAGHGYPQWSVGVEARDLEDVDLFPAVVLNGACNSGVTYKWFLGTPDKRVRTMPVEPGQSFALRVIRQGAVAHVAGVGGQCWAHCVPTVYPIYGAGQSVGEAVRRAYNAFIRQGATVEVRLLEIGKPWPSVEQWCTSFVRIAPCVLYGDPAYVPFPDARREHRGFPQQFDPWIRSPQREKREPKGGT